MQFTVSVATLSRTVSVSALPRRNASSGPSVAFVSARAFVFPDDDDDDDDSGLDDADAFEKTSSSFWTKLCRRRRRRRRVFPRVPVVETEGGTPGETMRSISHKFDAFAFVLHFLLLRIGFGFFSLQNTTNYIIYIDYKLITQLSSTRRSPTLIIIIIINPHHGRYRSEFLRLEAVDSISEWFVACLLERRLRRPSSRRSCPLQKNRPRESSRRSPSYRFESK